MRIRTPGLIPAAIAVVEARCGLVCEELYDSEW